MSWIGEWAARPGSPAHLVESEIATRLVMRCGRQMEVVNERRMLIAVGGSVPRCKQCVGRLA